MKAPTRRAAAVVATLTLGLALSPSAAWAAGKKVTQGNGTLQANGAALTLPATFTCPEGFMAYLTAQVIQAVDDEFAGGFDQAAKECTGEKQRVTFFIQSVPAGENTHPFRPGVASSRVIMDAVDPAAQDPYFEEPPAEGGGSGGDTGPLPVLPPLVGPSASSQNSELDDPMPTEPGPPPQPVHAEARGTIELKNKTS